MSFGLLFSGQGAQHAAMMAWLERGPFTEAVEGALRVSDWRQAMADAAWATRNVTAQQLLAGLQVAAWQQLSGHLPPPACVAGYSVGELAGHCAAGVIGAERIVGLAQARAQAMDDCADQVPGGLLAVTGIAGDAIERISREAGVDIAIRNGPDAVVLGGPSRSLAVAGRMTMERGARSQRLAVTVASHTRWMREASRAIDALLGDWLAEGALGTPAVPLFGGAGDRIWTAADARRGLAAQIAQTVRWDQCMENVASRQVRCVLEIGPGAGLARIWNERYPEIPARSVDEFRSVRAIVEWVVARGGITPRA